MPPQLDANGLDSSPHEMPDESIGSRPNALIFTTRESPAKCALESVIPPDRTTDMMVNGGGPMHKEKALTDTSNMASRLLSRGHRVGYVLNNPASTLIVRTEAINLYISWELDPSTCSLDHKRVHRSRWIEVEWLAPDNRLSEGSKDVESTDVDLLDSRTDKVIDCISASDPKPVIFKRGEHTVTLRQYYVDAAHSLENR